MGRLISLGDSFAALSTEPRSYLSRLAFQFDLEPYQPNPAVGASSLDHLFMQQWKSIEKDLRHGDRIIVTLTNPDRTFFFRENHLLSMPSCADDDWMSQRMEIGYRWTHEQKEAFRQYYTYLHSDERNLSWLESWLYQLDSVCRDLGTVAIVLDCFDIVTGTKSIDSSMHKHIKRGIGGLNTISMGEIADDATMRYIVRHVDPRLNHMMLRNHQALADKITQAWQGQELDLRHGFHLGCFNVTDIYDRSWFQENVGNGFIDYEWLVKKGR